MFLIKLSACASAAILALSLNAQSGRYSFEDLERTSKSLDQRANLLRNAGLEIDSNSLETDGRYASENKSEDQTSVKSLFHRLAEINDLEGRLWIRSNIFHSGSQQTVTFGNRDNHTEISVERAKQILQSYVPLSLNTNHASSIELVPTAIFDDAAEGNDQLTDQVSKLKAATSALMQALTSRDTLEDFSEKRLQLARANNELMAGLLEYEADESSIPPEQIEAAVATATFNAELDEKYYGAVEDIFEISTVRTMLRTAVSTCAINIGPKLSHGDVIGTGFLIGSNVVLTAAHVVEQAGYPNVNPTITVHFGVEGFSLDWIPGSSFRVSKHKLIDPDLDAAVLILEPDDSGKLPVDYRIDVAQREPVAYSDSPLKFLHPLCAIGHSRGQILRITDFGRVVLPNRANEMMLKQAAAYMARQNAAFGFGPTSEQYKSFLADLKALYAFDASQGLGFLCYRPKKKQTCIPVFGAELDGTFGNSGGPVINRITGKVVGMYVAGASDSPALELSPRTFEAVIPIDVISKALTKLKQ